MHQVHKKAFEYISSFTNEKYSTGIILGTGLGGLVNKINITHSLDYDSIPGFPVSTVEFHHGKLIFGKLSGKKIVAMQGRFHLYEGYSPYDITFPVHIMNALGVKNLIISNACGALNPAYRKTELMLINSHINFHFTSPLKNYNFSYKNSSHYMYDGELINLAESVAEENSIFVHKGVYATVQGPNLETRSEYRMLRKLGADVVGMSTIPELLISSKLGMRTLGISIITDEGFPDTLKVAYLKDIVEAAQVAERNLVKLTENLIKKL
ncbi:MAG TPA: purine-nucleoside phosphorylase [Bacteroidetes bacterium]|nr:purine-nucleoside phosphorylase [Bacteroidota bacterium]